MRVGERFTPHPNLKKVYFTYLAAIMTPILILISLVIVLVVLYVSIEIALILTVLYIPIAIVSIFISYWILRFYESISYMLTDEEVIVEKGVWWRRRNIVPYGRVMFVNTVQGPISRRFGVGAAHVLTAGYTGSTSPSGIMAKAEASIFGIQNFMEVRDSIIQLVRGRPLFARAATPQDLSQEILNELRKIREALERRPE